MPSHTPPPGGGGWYVVTIRQTVQSPFNVKVMQKPFPGPPAQVIVVSGPYSTQAEAQAAAAKFVHSANNPFPGASGIANTFTGIQNVGDFFHRLTETSTWIRVAEVIGGGILLFIGVRAVTHGSSTVGAGARKTVTKPVSKTAKRAITVAAPEARLATRTIAKRAAPKTAAKVSAHRAKVARYGQKTPYRPPAPRPPTIRRTDIYYHSQGKPVRKTVKKTP